jgi:hypothetical protein
VLTVLNEDVREAERGARVEQTLDGDLEAWIGLQVVRLLEIDMTAR